MEWIKLLSSKRIGKKIQGRTIARSAFEQDFDRIVFSQPFRLLQNKTQVFPLPEEDFVHNRLTHSLEVSSVARSLGRMVGKTIMARHPDLAKYEFSEFDFGSIVAAAALSHDIGNPPFGHSGEKAISDYFNANKDLLSDLELTPKEWMDLFSFEGNAQGFRLLAGNENHGLKLTNATLATFSKYPKQTGLKGVDSEKASQKKYGFFQTEKEIFQRVAKEVGLIKRADYTWGRHPLAFLVEAADDICYHIIDLEDGCRLGLVSFDTFLELLSPILKNRIQKNKLRTIEDQNEKLGILRAMAIGELIGTASQAFLDEEINILNGNYDSALTETIIYQNSLAEIKTFSIEHIYKAEMVLEKEIMGLQILPQLIDQFLKVTFPDKLQFNKQSTVIDLPTPQLQRNKIDKNTPDYVKLRILLDYISGMTDSSALINFKKFALSRT